jgi:nucleoside-diphosphate-sugar epimerase
MSCDKYQLPAYLRKGFTMSIKVLLTGGSGFIGGNVLKTLCDNGIEVTALIREQSLKKTALPDSVTVIPFDLLNHHELTGKLSTYTFDKIVHIGAVRGGRALSRDTYHTVNVEATNTLAALALQRNIPFVFCSSVGVFGAIPKEVPPTENTERQNDNFYHFTKITAEKNIVALGKEGLQYTILRPSITYGPGDYGFPFNLIHLVDKGFFLVAHPSIRIGMVDIRFLCEVFLKTVVNSTYQGKAYNICDCAPVDMRELVNFISEYLFEKKYPRFKSVPAVFFSIGAYITGSVLKNELWKARMELIGKSWYYDSKPVSNDFSLSPWTTIPAFSRVIEWYKTVFPERSKRWQSR